MKTCKFIVMISTICLLLSGCTSGKSAADETLVETGTESTTGTVDDIVDGMSSKKENDKEFYLMRVKDTYLEIPGECKWVYTEGEGEFPELYDGQIALVTADVRLYYGGETGFMGNIFIDTLKSYEIVSFTDVLDAIEIPDLYETEISYDNRMLSYQDEEHTYLIICNGQYIEVYEDGQAFMEYEYDSAEMLAPVYETLKKDLPATGKVGEYSYEIIGSDFYLRELGERGYMIDTLNQPDAPYFYTIASGMKNTGGYSISIENIYEQEDGTIVVVVREEEPEPGSTYTDVITYPTITVNFFPYPENIIIMDTKGNEYDCLNF